MLSKPQFNILSYLATNPGKHTQRQLAAETHASLGTVNRVCYQLREQNMLSDHGFVTPEGYEALEPYRVKRAVFFAAGFGSRMVPITLSIPKPLVRVKGVRIIDTLLDAVVAAGIEEIYIVRGYMKEQFDQLLYKYPTIQFLENPLYNESNTISSAFFAGDRIRNAYVLESDLLMRNPTLIQRYQYESNFLGIPMARTDDYYFKLEKSYICEAGIGGTDCYQAVGISYWTEEDGTRLAKDVAEDFNKPGGKELPWSYVALVTHANEYRVATRACTLEDIAEIDTFNELKAIDPAYGVGSIHSQA